MKTVYVQGQEIQVEFKKREVPSGPWVVLLHGLQSCHRAFDPFFNSAKFKSYSLLSIDFVGFGDSEKPPTFNYDIGAQGEVVLDLLSQLGIKKYSVVGHSMGGMVGTLLLEKVQGGIEALVSLEGSLTLADCGESSKIVKQSESDFSKNFPAWLEKIKGSGLSSELRYRWVQNMPSFVIYRAANSIVNWSKSDRLLDIFQRSLQPKLLIRGKKSTYNSSPNLPSTQLKIVEGSHFMLLEHPEEVMEVTSQFLDSLTQL
jgi:pimeloyl-ACP methyl ester carboxylesterase